MYCRLSVIRCQYIFLSFLILLCSSCTGKRASAINPPSEAIEKALQKAKEDPLIELSQPLSKEWWTLFHDDQLDYLMSQAFQRNPTLQEARANIFLAEANANRIRSVLFPNLYWGGDVSRSKLSETGLAFPHGPPASASATGLSGLSPTLPGAGIPLPGGQNGIPVYFTQYETQLNFTYEFDFWGKNRNTLRAAVGEYYARIADEQFTRLQIGIALVEVYYRLQIDYKRLQVARELVRSQIEYQNYIHERVKNNLDYTPILSNANINVASAEQILLQIEADVIINENKLKALVAGDFTEVIASYPIDEKRLPQVPMPGDLPLHLIAYRPDVNAKLWLIESAGRKIDVAKAGFYPDFNLTAFFGFQTLKLHELFNWPSSYYNVDPAFTLPIFDAGRLQANLWASEINYDIAIYEYNQLILDVVREVLDSIALLRNAEQVLSVYQEKVNQQGQILETTRLRVQNSLDSGLNLLTSEQNFLVARDQELIVLGNTYQAVIQLIKALGGGYETCYRDEIRWNQ